MKISNTMLAALVPAMVSLAPVAAHATAPVVTVFNSTALGFGGDVVLTINGVDYDAFNSGHYDNLGGHIFTNYQAGFDGFNNNPLSEVRNYFAFDLSNLTGPITSATLTIPSNPFGIGYENTSGTRFDHLYELGRVHVSRRPGRRNQRTFDLRRLGKRREVWFGIDRPG